MLRIQFALETQSGLYSVNGTKIIPELDSGLLLIDVRWLEGGSILKQITDAENPRKFTLLLVLSLALKLPAVIIII